MKKLYIALPIIALLAFGCGSSSNSGPSASSSNQTSVKPAPIKTQNKSNVSTPANWKTYSNTKYKYTISYPSTLQPSQYCIGGEKQRGLSIISSEKFSCDLSINSTTTNEIILQAISPNSKGQFIIPALSAAPTMQAIPLSTENKVLDVLTTNLTKYGFTKLTTTLINGVSATKFSYANHEYWYFIKNQIVWNISLNPLLTKQNDLRYEIIRTLTFQ